MSNYEVPEGQRYSDDDEWVRQRGDQMVIGVTDYAQKQLGDIVFIELPEVGALLEKGESYGVIESVKAVSDLNAPISGEVIEVNAELAERPEMVNEDCYGDGWFVVVGNGDGEEYEILLDPSAYLKHVEERTL